MLAVKAAPPPALAALLARVSVVGSISGVAVDTTTSARTTMLVVAAVAEVVVDAGIEVAMVWREVHKTAVVAMTATRMVPSTSMVVRMPIMCAAVRTVAHDDRANED